MEYNYSDLKKKSVINLSDGKNLGKICDLVISCPDGRVTGIIVPGKKGGLFGGSELIIGFGCIDRIGFDPCESRRAGGMRLQKSSRGGKRRKRRGMREPGI